MKILLINAMLTNPKSYSFFVRMTNNIFMTPSISIKQIATITPEKHSVKLVDEVFNKVKFNEDYDLIGISCIHTSTAKRAYEIADEFRNRRKTVVLGGWHPSMLPEEAKQHADSVVIGETEETWPILLKDFENGKLKPFYKQEKPVAPENIPKVNHSLINKITLSSLIYATRGCPYGCKFCAITSQKFGCIFRMRPIGHVIEEIKSIPQKFLIFIDPSFSINIEYTKQLFKAMKGLNKKFRCWMNANIPIHDKEFLQIAEDAGCIAIEIGFETLSQKTLESINKKTNNLILYKKIIREIHNHGIAVGGTFVLGFDTDTKKVFDETLQNISSLDIDFPRFAILTPLPGTPLFYELDSQGRILTKDWSKYDMVHVVFQPKHMSPEELQNEWYRIGSEVYSPTALVRRLFTNNKLHYYSWAWRFFSNIVEITK